MRCIDMKISVTSNIEKSIDKNKDREDIIGLRISDITGQLLNYADEGLIYASVYKIEDDHTQLSVCMCPDLIDLSRVKRIVEEKLNKVFDSSDARVESCREITVKKQKELDDEADSKVRFHARRHSPRGMRMDYFDNCNYKIAETVIEDDNLSKEAALKEAAALMADRSVYEEIERIYDPVNENVFYGHPVHYRIKAGDGKSAMCIIKLMVRMLKSRGRIPGDRISHLFDIGEGCYNEDDLNSAIKNAQGTAVAIELSGTKEEHGNYVTSYEAVVQSFAGLIEKYYHNTLFFFIENTEVPGFSPELIEIVAEYLDIVDLEEGTGSREESVNLLYKLIEASPYRKLSTEDSGNYLPKNRTVFTYHDVNVAYEKWKRSVLKEKAYRSYHKCRTLEKKKEKGQVSAYERLQKMIGLGEVKKVTDQIISSYKLQELRKNYRIEEEPISRHMIFTGNPGSAKTTVARLLADILTEEHILKTGCLVECGRQDLVGKYVGWTAQTVQAKFRKAKGGILFIDEAYSLVDGSSGSFGDEAINTIVQQMENYRNEVIVIFAGYPDRMDNFFQTNEGLRSRIAFHLDFPDYNAEELWEIMELMIRDRGYKAVDGIRERCIRLFREVCTIDDYGNGRFVRNYLDQVVLKQAERLMPPGSAKKPSRKSCIELLDEDFDVDMSTLIDRKESKKTIGFCA